MVARLPAVSPLSVLGCNFTLRNETYEPARIAIRARIYLVARKLAMAPAPSAETEAEAPVPEMPATVMLPALVTWAVLFDAWVMLPSVVVPAMEAPS